MFKNAINLFKKSKTCVIPCLLAFVGVVGYCAYMIFKNFNPSDVLLSERYVLEFSVVLFIVFLFLSYEYFSKTERVNFNECLSATKNGNLFRFNQFLVIELIALIFTVVLTLLSLLYPIRSTSADWQYFSYAIKLNLMYLFVADSIAILIGIVLSNIKNNIISYIILILCAFLFSPLALSIPSLIFATTEKIYIYPFFYMFEIMPHDFSGYNYDIYGFPLNSHNYMLALFWIALFLGILSFSAFKKNKALKKMISSALTIVVIITGIFVNLPHSEYLPNSDDLKRGTCEGVFYYNISTPLNEKPIQYNEPADFSITSLNIDLKVGRQLNAVVSIGVDKANLETYKFTLYRGYKLKNITDGNGNELKYDRYSDYVTVYPADNCRTDEIIFEYKGYSPTYFSNSQGIYLPAGFAYYPINGFHYMYDISTQGYLRTLLDNPVSINLSIDTKKTVYSNLDRVQEGKNEFSGTSDGLTIVSGFYKETEINGCRFIYKYIDEQFNNDNISTNIINTIKNNSNLFEGKTLVLSPLLITNTTYEYYFEASDHIMFTNAEYLVEGFEREYSSKTFMDLYYKLLTYYDENSELFKACTEVKNENNISFDKDDINYILAQKINEYGFDDVFSWVEKHNGEQFDGTMEEIAAQIGEKTELDLQFEEYEREMGLND